MNSQSATLPSSPLALAAWVCLCFVCVPLFSDNISAQGWQSERLHSKFYTEGAAAGDLNGDGHVDLVAGPLCFLGPTFEKTWEIAAAREFPISSYSDQFFSAICDVNQDGANDVIVIGFPGKPARVYLNPNAETPNRPWEMIEITGAVDNESPAIVDFIPGGLPEIVCGRDSQYGYYQAGSDPTQPWTWTPVTRPGACAGRFAHGLGVGDINGDGRLDLIDKKFWWEQPEELANSDEKPKLWKRHRWAPRDMSGGAQIQVGDVDGDGDADIITSIAAHAHGLSWFEQTENGEFVEHPIMGSASTDNEYGVSFSQLHAVEWVDVNGDGVKDIVTGKRWRAHRGRDADGLREPVLYWFECSRNARGEVSFIPHEIDNDSGVGTEVLVTDLNADGKPDVVSSNKRGLAIHLQQDLDSVPTPVPWRQSEGRDQDQYASGLEPEEAAEAILLPEGFSADLIASEPELTQPIAMCFDARGRIWVVEGHTYPTKAPEGEGRDRIVIFEDTDADGSYETKRTFLEGVNLASGIEVGFGGVWIGAAPELLFVPDADHDGTPDGPPQVLLDGWGYQDTHETLNSFTWGPDGWLYGCHGVFTHSEVGKPGTPSEQREKLNAGVWRYHPSEHRFEVFAHGTSNPWGVDFNDRGDCFITACVIPHLYHLTQGGRYQRQAGQHFNTATYDDIKTIADHAHFAGNIRDHAFWGANRTEKPPAPINTSLLGGGHAHCGLAIYDADVFPESYRGDLFFHNLHGHRVVRETLVRDGSGYVGLHRPDFALARDHKAIGVGIMLGPDGALYTSDWHDIQTCHNREQEIWDRTNGRLFRIRYGEVRPQSFNLWNESNETLLTRLASDNAFFARQAQRVLQERSLDETFDREGVAASLDRIIESSDSPRNRLRMVWTKACMGSASESDLIAWMNDPDSAVRSWAVQFAGEGSAPLSDKLLQRVVSLARSDKDFDVRRYLAALLQRLPREQRWPIIEALTSQDINQHDRNLPWLVWYGVEPLARKDPARVLEIAKKSGWGDLYRFAVRRVAGDAGGREALVKGLKKLNDGDSLLVLRELVSDATRRGGAKMPTHWQAAREKLMRSKNPEVRSLVHSLAIRYGDETVFPFFRRILSDSKQPKKERLEALTSLLTARDPGLPSTLLDLMDDPGVSSEAVAALAAFDDAKIADQLLKRYPQLQPATQTAALSVLTSRKSSTLRLIEAMESSKIDPKTVPAFIISQAVSVIDDKKLLDRIGKVWGRITSSSESQKAAYEKYHQLLTPQALAKADASAGRVIYEANCGTCHRLFGEGFDIGPDITGANRSSLDYLLENILQPNALIGRAYQTTNVLTTDGRVITGIVVDENDDAVTVQTATQQVIVPSNDIEERFLSNVSLMPTGQLEPMTDSQVKNLFRYLMSPSQVARPGEKPLTVTRASRSDAIVLEAESIQPVEVTAGRTREQNMRGFGELWSADAQLWWTGGRKGAKLKLDIPTPQRAGEYDVVIFFTMAQDYAAVSIQLDDRKPKTADLYNQEVTVAGGIQWDAVATEPSKKLPLQIKITGKNEAAIPRHMLGIDRIEFVPK